MRRVFAAFVCVMAVMSPLPAQDLAGSDDAAIRQRLADYAEARTRRDAAAEARCYTPDGDFRSSRGPFVSGREAIERQLTVSDPTYTFGLTVTKLRMLTADVAMVDAEVTAGPAGRTATLLGSYVMVREGTTWLIAAARIAPPPR